MAGGLFDSFQRAVDLGRARRAQDEERLYIQGERAYQDARRAKLDPINDELLGLQVGEARFNAEGQPLRRRQQIAQTTSAETGAKLGEFNLRRAPTLAAQQDTLHGLNVESAGLNMTLARNRDAREGARHKRDMEESDYRLQAQKLQLSSAQIDAERKELLAKWLAEKQPIYALGRKGEHDKVLGRVERLYKEVNDGNGDSGVRYSPEIGYHVIDTDTGEVVDKLGGIDGLFDYIDMYAKVPEIFEESYVRQRNAAAQRAAAEAAAEERRRGEAGKNFRAGLNAAGSALSNTMGRDPSGVIKSLVSGARRIAESAPGASPREAPERRPIPTAIVDQAVREIPGPVLDSFIQNAANPEHRKMFDAAFGAKYGEGIADAIAARLAEIRQQQAATGDR